MSITEFQRDVDLAIDRVLDLLEVAATEGYEMDPLGTIIARMKARGSDLDLDDAPPVMRMLLGGMLG